MKNGQFLKQFCCANTTVAETHPKEAQNTFQ